MDLSGLLTAQVLGFFLVFARLGSAMVFMPGFGEAAVIPRHRVFFALLMSLALYPATPVTSLPIDNPLALFPLYALEITVGLWIGLTARIIMTTLQFTGSQIGLVSGLANAFAPEMGNFQGANMIASALLIAGVTLVFVTDLHHVIIRALIMSYDVFPIGRLVVGDLAQQMVKAVSASFYIGAALAAPFYVMGLVLNAGLGLANRMMPSLPVFFVAAPVLIAAGLFVMVVAIPSMMQNFLARFTEWFGSFTF